MRSMRLKSVGLLAAAVVAATAVTASADSVSYTSDPFSGSSSFTAVVQQFDSSLGTLSNVSITLNMNLTPEIIIYNFTGSSKPYDAAFTNTTGPGATPVSWTDPYGGAASDNFSMTIGAGSAGNGMTTIDGTPIVEATSSSVPSIHVGDYIGTGTVPVVYDVSGLLRSGITQSSGIFGGGDYKFDGTATVTYTYTADVGYLGADPVPLPASAGVGFAMLAGLGAVFAARKRLRRAARTA